jgi:hypothetical protein
MKRILVGLALALVLMLVAVALLNRQATPYALIDLVEADTEEEQRAFVELATGIAEELGGHAVLVNRALVPMIVPAEQALDADQQIQLLVITEYPDEEARESALSRRAAKWSGSPLKTYAAQQVGGIESLISGSLPSTIGRFRQERVPSSDDQVARASLIETSGVVEGAPETGIYTGQWEQLLERSGDRPIWMLNFLEFRDAGDYDGLSQALRPETLITGEEAYGRYGAGMIGSLAAVGGRVGWSGHSAVQRAGVDDGNWDQIVVAVYPSTMAMMTMLALDDYRAAHPHRIAGLARTRLLATQPVSELD